MCGNVRRYVALAQSRVGACFCTRGAKQGYDVICFFRVGKNRDTTRGSPAGAGAGRTADYLAVLFSQKILAVRKANDIYRPVGISYFLKYCLSSSPNL
jgi:hypothetical protein